MEQYILKYLQDHTDSNLVKKYIDYFKVNLDGRLYAYGDNMNHNYPEPQKWTLRNYLKDAKKYIMTKSASSFVGKESNVLSLLRMPNSISSKYGLNIVGTIFNPTCLNNVKSIQLINDCRYLSEVSSSYDFNRFLDENVLMKIEEIKDHIKKEYQKYCFKALFVGNGEPFINKLHIDVFKELDIPSFIFLHGIPGVYNLETEKKADFLFVWGEKIKQNYINAGFDKDRIFVIGSPKVKYKVNTSLRHSLDNVLVTTSSSVEWSPFGWDYTRFPLNDRSLIILYCYVIQDVLQKVGVSKARLRLHPSVGKNWINHYIDNSFYTIDHQPLQASLSEASLVIGPTSTVWLESLLEGVNYIVFEPGEGEFNFRHIAMVPPFDNSDDNLRIAKTEEDLLNMIKTKNMPNLSIINDYIQPFNFAPVYKLLKQTYE